MQRILSIFLLLVFTAGTTYWGLRLAGEKRAARKEARQRILQGLDREELQLLSFRKHSPALRLLDWQHEGEFKREGQLYDIVSIQESADSIHYTCYPDKKESQVDVRIGALCKLLYGQQPFRQQHEQQWVSFLRGLMMPAQAWEMNAIQTNAACHAGLSRVVACDGFSDMFLPPPEESSDPAG